MVLEKDKEQIITKNYIADIEMLEKAGIPKLVLI